MSLEIKLKGKLIHVFRSSIKGADIIRHSLQVLCQPATGNETEKFDLETCKLPKGSSDRYYIDRIGQNIEITLSQWSVDGKTGFYIPEEGDITFVEENTKDR